MIALVGGDGFLGSRLAEILHKADYDFRIFDIKNENKSANFSNLNIENPNLENNFLGYDCIINLAAVHHDNVRPISRYYDVNVSGAVNICNAARKCQINKIIFTSSVAIYGFAPANTKEDGLPNYFNDYGKSKFEAEAVYKEWLQEDPETRTLVIIRPTVIFGEGNRGNVYNLLKQIESKKFLMIGNGKNIKSMAYVGNVAAFIAHTLNFSNGLHIYNYVDKPDLSMRDLTLLARKSLHNKSRIGLSVPVSLGVILGFIADIFSKLLKLDLPISLIRIKKFISTTQFDSSVSETSFRPPTSLKEGLTNTIKNEFLRNKY